MSSPVLGVAFAVASAFLSSVGIIAQKVVHLRATAAADGGPASSDSLSWERICQPLWIFGFCAFQARTPGVGCMV